MYYRAYIDMSSKVKSIEGKVEEYRRKMESLDKDVSHCVKSVEDRVAVSHLLSNT